MKLVKALFFISLCGFQNIHAGEAVPQRVISLSPNLTEIVYDIGAQDQLVGVTEYCKFPPEAQKKEKIGGWINPNFEKIVSLKPDLVLALQFDEKAIATLSKLKIPVAIFSCDSVPSILKAYKQIGQLLGRENAAETARKALAKRLEKIQRKAKGQKPLSVLFVVGRTPGTLDQVYAVGGKNFINELIQMAGGVNVMASAMTDYPLVSKEELIQSNPDLIIDSLQSHDIKAKDMEKHSVWNQMPVLKAVKQKQVYYFYDPSFLIPGPSMVKLAEFLCDTFETIHSSQK